MANVHVVGAESLDKKLKMIQDPTAAVAESMKKEIRRVRNAAALLCPVNHGELRQSIRTDVKVDNDMVVGVCYTNNQHAAYVEFGTGPKGEENHKGISPNVQPTYTQQGWWFPGNNTAASDADLYHFATGEADDGTKLYFTKGQPAQPYMYPALKMNENIVKANIAQALQAEIRKVGDS